MGLHLAGRSAPHPMVSLPTCSGSVDVHPHVPVFYASKSRDIPAVYKFGVMGPPIHAGALPDDQELLWVDQTADSRRASIEMRRDIARWQGQPMADDIMEIDDVDVGTVIPFQVTDDGVHTMFTGAVAAAKRMGMFAYDGDELIAFSKLTM